MNPFITQPDADVLELTDVAVLEEPGLESHIVIFNDEVNTFDWVIQCLMEVLDHTNEQSEQLAMMIHYKGRASVKDGSMDELRPLKDNLCERGLSAVIESHVA